jgi:glycosyltransferase involved in cell wall biosynthesis
MIFHNRFVSETELNEFLSAADIYLTPYLQPQQITSGTLAYALGAGKAVISTPYPYARDLLADGRGILVPWRDSQAIAQEVVGLLDDSSKLLALRERGEAYGRSMRWPVVARRYMESFERARTECAEELHTSFQAMTLAKRRRHSRCGGTSSSVDQTGVLSAAFSVRAMDGCSTTIRRCS